MASLNCKSDDFFPIKRLGTNKEDVLSIQTRTDHQSVDGVAAYSNLNHGDSNRQQNYLYGEASSSSQAKNNWR